MKLKDQVTSLKLSKKLKKLGVKQESIWYWTDFTGVKTKVGGRFYTTDWYITDNNLVEIDKVIFGKHYISAFTVAELGEKLPLSLKEDADKGISFSVETKGLQIYKSYDNKSWIVSYGGRNQSNKSEAEARGEMLAYLIKNKLIKTNQ